MDNRIVAVLEHFGFLTRKEAEHIADGIKTGVGSETYIGAFEIVENIIKTGEFEKRSLISDLEAKITSLENHQQEFKDLLKQTTDKYESQLKEEISKLKAKNKNSVDTAPKAK